MGGQGHGGRSMPRARDARKRDRFAPSADEIQAPDETVMIEQEVIAAERNAALRAAFAELTGVDVAEGIGLLVKKPDDRAAIRCGVAQFGIESGTAHVQNIVFDTQNVLIKGGGQVYLGSEKLDIAIQGQPKKIRVVRLRAPVEIRGQLLKPSFKLETGHLLKQGAIGAAYRLGELSRERIRARFEERFTARRMAQDYLAAYRSLMNQEHPHLRLVVDSQTALTPAE